MDPLEFAVQRRIAAEALKSFAEDEIEACVAQIAALTPAEPPVEQPPVDAPPVEEPPAPIPDPTPAPVPVPDPDPVPPAPPTVPAQPVPASRYYEVALIRTGVREVINATGVKVTATNTDVDAWPSIDTAPVPAGITVTPDEVIVGKYAGDLHFNIGKRQLTVNAGADLGLVRVYGMAPKSKLGGVIVNTGARVRSLNGSILDGSLGVSKAVWQGHSGGGATMKLGSIDEIVDNQFINQQGDGPKVAGSEFGVQRIEGNLFGQQERGYGGAHYDQTTIMNALNGLLIKGNVYDNLIDDDTVGVNNWLQFAPYWASAIYGDVMVTENIMIHLNAGSFAMMKGSQYIGSATFGRIDLVGNWMKKAGDIRNVFYSKNNFATSFVGNINLDTGQVFSV